MTEQEILALRFTSMDLDKELSIREYLIELLSTLWTEEEGFSGKRPFGNSGWKGDVAVPLVKAGAIKGTITEDPDCWDIDYDNAELDEVMSRCIRAL